MRKTGILTFLLLLTAFWTGCKKDKAPDPRDIFVSTYSVTESWSDNGQLLTKPAFTMSVEKSTQQSDKILFINFANYGAGITADATVSGTKITIPQQTLSNSKSITGTGTLADPTLSFTYTESINNISIEITATAKKK
jgi:hypothetical protein